MISVRYVSVYVDDIREAISQRDGILERLLVWLYRKIHSRAVRCHCSTTSTGENPNGTFAIEWDDGMTPENKVRAEIRPLDVCTRSYYNWLRGGIQFRTDS